MMVCLVAQGLVVGQGRCMADAALNRLLNLKVAKDRKGMAPNKALLVLAILDLVGSRTRGQAVPLEC